MNRHVLNLNVCINAANEEQAKQLLEAMFFKEKTSEGNPYLSHVDYVRELVIVDGRVVEGV